MATLDTWEIRPVNASELPHHLPLNGIYENGRLIATVGNYNHVGSEKYARLIAAAPMLAAALLELLDNTDHRSLNEQASGGDVCDCAKCVVGRLAIDRITEQKG